MSWLKEVIGTEKAIIAMLHLQAMPGDPYYDKNKGMKYVIEKAKEDLDALQDGGVDAIMFSNEFSLPYLTKVNTETVAAMARVIGELMPNIDVPYGVNVLWDPQASLDLAAAVDAKFIREIFTGVYASDFGLWNTHCGEVVRHQRVYWSGKRQAPFQYSTGSCQVPCRQGYTPNSEVDRIQLQTGCAVRLGAYCRFPDRYEYA